MEREPISLNSSGTAIPSFFAKSSGLTLPLVWQRDGIQLTQVGLPLYFPSFFSSLFLPFLCGAMPPVALYLSRIASPPKRKDPAARPFY